MGSPLGDDLVAGLRLQVRDPAIRNVAEQRDVSVFSDSPYFRMRPPGACSMAGAASIASFPLGVVALFRIEKENPAPSTGK